MNNVEETLTELGYSFSRQGEYLRMKALYRNGDNPSSLSVHSKTGVFMDFPASIKGDWKKFLELNIKDGATVEKYLNNESDIIIKPKPVNPLQIKKYSIDCLDRLLPLYDFYLNRGISIETLKLFRAGLATNGKFCNRLIFPIFNEQKEILGFAGRQIIENSKYPKWLLLGKKTYWAYPLFINRQIILDKREIILVESIGDFLALWEAGIRNVLVIFGLSLGQELLKQLLALNPKKIFISANDDKDKKKNWGQEGAEKLKNKLSNYFDNVEMLNCPKNDWGLCSKEEIEKFFHE